MDAIKNGALTLVAVSFLSAIFDKLTKEDKKIRYISGIILTTCMIQFVAPIVQTVIHTDLRPQIEQGKPDDSHENDDSLVIQSISVQLCKNVKQLVVNRFSIPESTFTVSVTVERSDDEEITLKAITIRYFPPDDGLTEYEIGVIAKYISDTFAAPCVFLTESS